MSHKGFNKKSQDAIDSRSDLGNHISGDTCITCSDEVLSARVIELVNRRCSKVLMNGLIAKIDVSLVGPVNPGDVLLVHAGVALSRECSETENEDE